LNIEITGKQLQRFGSHTAVFGRPADYQDRRLSGLVMQIYRELHHADDVTPLALEALTLELLIGIVRSAQPSPNEPSWLPKVRELLHERFTEPFSLAKIAAAVEVHPAHLARTFRRFHRQTIGDYVRRLRIEFARARLSSSADPISSIALAAGFYDQCHFTRTFKNQLGMTPAEYRTTFARSSSVTKPQT
jgi:AraC family transcriptional regulator